MSLRSAAGASHGRAAGSPDPGGDVEEVPFAAQPAREGRPGAGGALWRLRYGLQAATPGPVGHADLLIGMQEAEARRAEMDAFARLDLAFHEALLKAGLPMKLK